MSEIDLMCKEVHAIAVKKGWWEDLDAERDFAKILTRMHSELSDAYVQWRDVFSAPLRYAAQGALKPEGFGIELADCVIRIMDFCCAAGISLDEMLRIKIAYNKTRPYRHGGKRG